MSRTINFQTISWFWDLYNRGLLDLNPPYQRRSVWNQNYKDYFIDTVLNGYPAPAIFIYQEITPEGVSKVSIVDGKQRLSTLFEFAKNEFPVYDKATIQKFRGKYFKDLDTETKQNFWKYQFAIEYVPADEEKIGNIFDRINRNVIKLTPQELRHARFDGRFITTVEELTPWMFKHLSPDGKNENFPNIDKRTKKQMKDFEMVAQLLLFLEDGVRASNQDYLDNSFSERDIEWENKENIEAEFRSVIDSIKKILELSLSQDLNLYQTRLKNQADFYSLFSSIAELQRENKLQITKKVGERIYQFLERVDNEQERENENNKDAMEYYNAVKFSFTDAGTRKTRIKIMKSVILGES
jgi:hypothetical protein